MKNKSYIGISLIVLIFGIWTVKELKERFKKTDLAIIKDVPRFELTDQNNKKINPESLNGKVYVLEFFFSTCTTICPKMNKNMLVLQDEFYGNLDFAQVSITINPTVDTAATLKKHANELGVKNPNWHFLTGNEETIMELANKDFYLQAGRDKLSPDGFGHSGQVVLIDKKGKIRSRKDNFGNPISYYDIMEEQGVAFLKEDIKELLKD